MDAMIQIVKALVGGCWYLVDDCGWFDFLWMYKDTFFVGGICFIAIQINKLVAEFLSKITDLCPLKISHCDVEPRECCCGRGVICKNGI